MGATHLPERIRFWAKVDSPTSGCWEWQGAYGTRGYPAFNSGHGVIPGHRYAYEMTYGTIPDGAYVLHRCDNQRCVRPDHLFVGSQLDNMRDMIAKGRRRNQYTGSTHCKRGHELNGDNLRVEANGSRACRTCKRIAMRGYRSNVLKRKGA